MECKDMLERMASWAGDGTERLGYASGFIVGLKAPPCNCGLTRLEMARIRSLVCFKL